MDIPLKWQMTIHVGLEKTSELIIQWSNDADLEMSIVDKGFKFLTWKIFFTLLLLYLHYIATKILFLAIKGELLDVNFTHVYGRNKYRIMKNAKVFGLGWLGDGSTIKKMPLLSMLVMCGGEAPMVVSVCDWQTIQLMETKMMLSVSWNSFNRRWKIGIHLTSTWTAFLMVHQTYKQREQFFVLTTLELCVSMEGSMFCHFFRDLSKL